MCLSRWASDAKLNALLRRAKPAQANELTLSGPHGAISAQLQRPRYNVDSLAAVCIVVTDLTDARHSEELSRVGDLGALDSGTAPESIVVWRWRGRITRRESIRVELCGQNPLLPGNLTTLSRLRRIHHEGRWDPVAGYRNFRRARRCAVCARF